MGTTSQSAPSLLTLLGRAASLATFATTLAGVVFLWEGILKFVYANQGVGRFTKLGMPFPHFTADSVACLEIVGGILLLSGLMTRLIAIPFIVEMIVVFGPTSDFRRGAACGIAGAFSARIT